MKTKEAPKRKQRVRKATAPPFDVSAPDEETELRALARALELSRGFKLLFARCNQRDQQHHHGEVEHYVGSGDQRHRREHRHRNHDRRECPHTRSPNKPFGRNSNTRMNITKMPIWPSDSPR